MMEIEYTEAFRKKAQKLVKRNQRLKNRLRKQLQLFTLNPKHPSLKLHKLQGDRSVQYAVWIEGDLRALFVIEEGVYIFFNLKTHDEY